MITVWETVVVEDNRGIITIHGVIHDFALFLRDAGADKDGTMCRVIQAVLFLLTEALRVFTMADNGQAAALRKESAVAEGIAGDEAVSQKQAALYLR